MAEKGRDLARNLARLMARRHLRSYLDIVGEESLTDYFYTAVQANPGMKMKDVALLVEKRIRREQGL